MTAATILQRHLSAGAWSDWSAVSGLDAGSGPGAVVLGNTILLFARGQDGAMWQNTLADGGMDRVGVARWTATSAPSAACGPARRRSTWRARGHDNALWHRTLVVGAGMVARGRTLGGNLGSAPSAAAFSDIPGIDFFVRDVERRPGAALVVEHME